MLPTRETALALLDEAAMCNPGPWRAHSLVAAGCAYKIAGAIGTMDAEKAYILGLLHDIGRRFGVTGMVHAIDGYDYLRSLGYEEAARICLTHSFAEQDISVKIGKWDITAEEETRMAALLASYEYDDYDRLIQVCDSVAMAEGPADMETRMGDVKRRYGYYPQSKWDKHLELKAYFEQKAGKTLSEIIAAI